MPYSVPLPAPAPLPVHSQGRVGHRRSYTTERGPGAFAPLRLVPRRAPGPVFHFRNDDPELDDDDDSSSSPDDDSHPPPLKLRPNAPLRLTLNTNAPASSPQQKPCHSVPFPRTSPQSTPQLTTLQLPSPHGLRSQVARTSSTPILLSNGKPLKSSLKSSSSSPNIPSNHLRTRSAPVTPHPDRPSSPEDESYTVPTTPKNVRFPSKDLETICIFSKSARPASLSRSGSFCDDTETDETEGEGYSGRASFPFPRCPGSSPIREDITASLAKSKGILYELDTLASSTVPTPSASPYGNVYIETLSFVHSPSPALAGSLLVRNLSYEKQVAVRFTLDDWVTTSEVIAHHAVSLSALPPTFASKTSLTVGDVIGMPSDRMEWDRFEFTVRLADYAMKLENRVVWLVARYGAPDGAEWWDNNNGANYRVSFRKKEVEPPVRERKERTLSAPASLPAQTPVVPAVPAVTVLPAYSPPMTYQTPDQHQAITQSTLTRLKRLNLRNYAAPSVGSTPTSSLISPATLSASVPVPVSETHTHDLSVGASPSMSASPPFSTLGSSPRASVAWSWGTSSTRSSFDIQRKHEEDGKLSASSSSDSISSSSDGLRTPPMIHSPQPSSLLLSVDDYTGNVSPQKKSPSPPLSQRTSTSVRPGSRSPSPSSDSGTDSEPVMHDDPPSNSTPRAFSEDSDSVYQAFVKKWCFSAGPGRVATV